MHFIVFKGSRLWRIQWSVFLRYAFIGRVSAKPHTLVELHFRNTPCRPSNFRPFEYGEITVGHDVLEQAMAWLHKNASRRPAKLTQRAGLACPLPRGQVTMRHIIAILGSTRHVAAICRAGPWTALQDAVRKLAAVQQLKLSTDLMLHSSRKPSAA